MAPFAVAPFVISLIAGEGRQSLSDQEKSDRPTGQDQTRPDRTGPTDRPGLGSGQRGVRKRGWNPPDTCNQNLFRVFPPDAGGFKCAVGGYYGFGWRKMLWISEPNYGDSLIDAMETNFLLRLGLISATTWLHK